MSGIDDLLGEEPKRDLPTANIAPHFLDVKSKESALVQALGFDPDDPLNAPTSLVAGSDTVAQKKLSDAADSFAGAASEEVKDTAIGLLPEVFTSDKSIGELARESIEKLPMGETFTDVVVDDKPYFESLNKNIGEVFGVDKATNITDVDPVGLYRNAQNALVDYAIDQSAIGGVVESGVRAGMETAKADTLSAASQAFDNAFNPNNDTPTYIQTLWEDTTGEKWVTDKQLNELKLNDPIAFQKARLGQTNFVQKLAIQGTDILKALPQLAGIAGNAVRKGQVPANTLRVMAASMVDDAATLIDDPARRMREDPLGVLMIGIGAAGLAGRVGNFAKLAKTGPLRTALSQSLPVPFSKRSGNIASNAATADLFDGVLGLAKSSTLGKELLEVAPDSPRQAVSTTVRARQRAAGEGEVLKRITDDFKKDMGAEFGRWDGMPLDSQKSAIASQWFKITEELDSNFDTVKAALDFHEAFLATRDKLVAKVAKGQELTSKESQIMALPDDPKLILRLANEPALDQLFDNGIRGLNRSIADKEALLVSVRSGNPESTVGLLRKNFGESTSQMIAKANENINAVEIGAIRRNAARERTLSGRLQEAKDVASVKRKLGEMDFADLNATALAKQKKTVSRTTRRLNKQLNKFEDQSAKLNRIKASISEPADSAMASLSEVQEPAQQAISAQGMLNSGRQLAKHKRLAAKKLKDAKAEFKAKDLARTPYRKIVDDINMNLALHAEKVATQRSVIAEWASYNSRKNKLEEIATNPRLSSRLKANASKLKSIADDIEKTKDLMAQQSKALTPREVDTTATNSRLFLLERSIDEKLASFAAKTDAMASNRRLQIRANAERRKTADKIKFEEETSKLTPQKLQLLGNKLESDLVKLRKQKDDLLLATEETFNPVALKQNGAWLELDGELVGGISAAKIVSDSRRAGLTSSQIFDRMQVKGTDPLMQGFMDKAKALGTLQSKWDEELVAAGVLTDGEAAARLGVRLNKVRDPSKASDYLAPLYKANPEVALLETSKAVQHLRYTDDMRNIEGVLADVTGLQPWKGAKGNIKKPNIGGEQMPAGVLPDGQIVVQLPMTKSLGEARKYGSLAGEWVTPDTAKLIQNVIGTKAKWYERFSSIWKKTKVIMNPKSHLNMQLGNTMAGAAGGLKPGAITMAGRIMDGKGTKAEQILARHAEQRGVWEGSSMQAIDHLYGQGKGTVSDIAQQAKALKSWDRGNRIKSAAALGESGARFFVDNVMGVGGALERSWVRHDRKFRLALYKQAVETIAENEFGLSKKDLQDPAVMAAIVARPAVSNTAMSAVVEKALDYGSLPRGPRVPGTVDGAYELARSLGPIPFLAYDLKATPLWTKLFFQNAYKARLAENASMADWATTEQAERLRRQASEREGNRGWQLYGSDYSVNTRFMSPVSIMPLSLAQDFSADGAEAFAPWAIGPAIEALSGTTTDGREIYPKGANAKEKWSRSAYHYLNAIFLSPPLGKVMGTAENDFNGIWRRLGDVKDRATGREYNVNAELLKVFVTSTDEQRLRAENAVAITQSRAVKQRQKLWRDLKGSVISEEEYTRKIEQAQTQLWSDLGQIAGSLESR